MRGATERKFLELKDAIWTAVARQECSIDGFAEQVAGFENYLAVIAKGLQTLKHDLQEDQPATEATLLQGLHILSFNQRPLTLFLIVNVAHARHPDVHHIPTVMKATVGGIIAGALLLLVVKVCQVESK